MRDELELGAFREGLPDLVAAVAHDHGDTFRLQGGGHPEHAFDECQAANLMQYLGQLGLHPRALTGGEDNDVYVRHARGIQTLILVRTPRFEVRPHAIHSWSISLFIAFDDLVDLLRGEAKALAGLPGNVPF